MNYGISKTAITGLYKNQHFTFIGLRVQHPLKKKVIHKTEQCEYMDLAFEQLEKMAVFCYFSLKLYLINTLLFF